MKKFVAAAALATLIASPTLATEATNMAQDSGLGSAGAWVSAPLLIAVVIITGVVISFFWRRMGRATQRELELDLIRREMLDECFAKGEMFREDCEGRCNELAHARETTHPPPSARSNLAS